MLSFPFLFDMVSFTLKSCFVSIFARFHNNKFKVPKHNHQLLMGKKATLKPVMPVRLTDSDHCFCHGSDGCGGMCNIAPCLNSFKGSKAGSHKLSVEFKGMKCMFHILPSGENPKMDWG